jgi:peptide deformylase
VGIVRDDPAPGRQHLNAWRHDEVQRHARVRISYHDVNGNMQTEESDGLRAVCHQHEIDQLNGQFWINRLSRLKRDRLIKRFEKVSRRP